jgi:hypothetical protein
MTNEGNGIWSLLINNYSTYYGDSGIVNTSTSTVTNPVFIVRVNDDNKGWSEPKLIPLGATGSNHTPIRVQFGGIYRKRQLEISCTDACEFVLSKAEEFVEVIG